MKFLDSSVERLLYIALAVVFLGVVAADGLLIYLTFETNHSIKVQQQQVKASNAYIKCIAKFLNQPNRAQLSLSDLAGCAIVPH